MTESEVEELSRMFMARQFFQSHLQISIPFHKQYPQLLQHQQFTALIILSSLSVRG